MFFFYFIYCILYIYDIWDFEIEFGIESVDRVWKERYSFDYL